MEKKLNSIIGISLRDFNELNDAGQIQFRPARLIPVLKPGDEMALTSVILSSTRIIKEFGNLVFGDLKMARGGQIHVFTEVTFPGFEDSRIDGLVIIVKGGVIKDATFFEMKNGTSEIDVDQITKYIEIAKKYI